MKKFSGCFITVEGGEGSGKTTLINQLAAFLTRQGREVCVTREPGGTPLSEIIRGSLLSRHKEVSIGAVAELLLFLAARAQHIEEKIRPALESGYVVLCDRFNDSTIAYQGGARELGVPYVRQLCRLICGDVVPQLTLFLSVSPEIGLARTRKACKEQAPEGQLDRIESEELAFHRRIQRTFQELARDEPERLRTLDAEAPQERVLEEAIQVVRRALCIPRSWEDA